MKKIFKYFSWIILISFIYLGINTYLELDKAEVFKTPVYETQVPTLPDGFAGPAVLVFSKTNEFRHHDAIAAANKLFKDHADEKPLLRSLDKDGDGDHDMDDHEKARKDKDEAYMNEPDEDEKSIDYMNNKLAGGMNRPKDTFPKVADADNPMQKKKFESGDLRAQIRAELLQRLAEAKGAK